MPFDNWTIYKCSVTSPDGADLLSAFYAILAWFWPGSLSLAKNGTDHRDFDQSLFSLTATSRFMFLSVQRFLGQDAETSSDDAKGRVSLQGMGSREENRQSIQDSGN